MWGPNAEGGIIARIWVYKLIRSDGQAPPAPIYIVYIKFQSTPGNILANNGWYTAEIRFMGEYSTGLLGHTPTTTTTSQTISTEASIGVGLTGTTVEGGLNLGFAVGNSITYPNLRVYDRSDPTDYDIQMLYI